VNTIVGIESSCDDSSIAVVNSNFKILSSVTRTHLECLKPYQGVMPEIVSREHCRILPTLIELISQDIALKYVDAIAYTAGPGLAGSLLIGSHVARTLSLFLQKPLIPIHHLEGHVLAALLEHSDPFCDGPVMGLIVSGGHTQFVYMPKRFEYHIVGQTRDDAAGEAFDKIAKNIGLGYPGGPALSALAEKDLNPKALFSIPLKHSGCLDMSFSGLKTQASRFDYQSEGLTQIQYCSAVQEAITESLAWKTECAFQRYPAIRSFILCGGVASNPQLRSKIRAICTRKNINLLIPSPPYCTDNGAMIAAAGQYHFLHAGPALDRSAGIYPRWILGEENANEHR
jgi:N6-L-threonylcarbamoyladenine synthase